MSSKKLSFKEEEELHNSFDDYDSPHIIDNDDLALAILCEEHEGMEFEEEKEFKEWYIRMGEFYVGYKLIRIGLDYDHVTTKRIKELLEKEERPSRVAFIFDSLNHYLRNNDLFDLMIKYRFRIGAIARFESMLAVTYNEHLNYIAQEYLPKISISKKKAKEADIFALKVGDKINEFHEEGKLTLEEKAKALEDCKILTPNGGKKWEPASVRKVYLRWQEIVDQKVDLSDTYKSKSENFAQKMKPIFKSLEDEGFKTTREKAEELNRREIPTYRGKLNWQSGTVFNVQKRISKLSSNNDLPKPE